MPEEKMIGTVIDYFAKPQVAAITIRRHAPFQGRDDELRAEDRVDADRQGARAECQDRPVGRNQGEGESKAKR